MAFITEMLSLTVTNVNIWVSMNMYYVNHWFLILTNALPIFYIYLSCPFYHLTTAAGFELVMSYKNVSRAT